jgi:hypothetical protein
MRLLLAGLIKLLQAGARNMSEPLLVSCALLSLSLSPPPVLSLLFLLLLLLQYQLFLLLLWWFHLWSDGSAVLGSVCASR